MTRDLKATKKYVYFTSKMQVIYSFTYIHIGTYYVNMSRDTSYVIKELSYSFVFSKSKISNNIIEWYPL